MRRIVFLGLLVALAACNNDSTSPNGSAVGSYSLHTYNGAILPVDIGTGEILTSDQLVLNANGTYVDHAIFSNSTDIVEQGNWSINNNLITFNDLTDNIVYSGSLSGDVLTESFPVIGGGSVIEVFQRQ